MRTDLATLIKHRLSLSVLAVAALAAACATSSDSTQPTAPTETTATTAAPSTTAPDATSLPEISATQPPATTAASPIATSYGKVEVSDAQPTTDTTAPLETSPPPLLGNMAVVASSFSTCSLNQNGSVYCWGDHPDGESDGVLVSGDEIPVQQTGIADAVAITSSSNRKCVVLADGTVSCWQGNSAPVEIENITDAVGVSASRHHVCAVHEDGTVSCWGKNGHGQLGNGQVENLPVGGDNTMDVPYAYVPVKVKGISDAVEVAASDNHTCALHADGTVSCWGKNGHGQLGDGSTDDSSVPVKVAGITDAISVAADYGYSCAIHADRGVSCWGNNQFGILGFYSESSDYDFSISRVSGNRISLEPIRVPEVSEVISLHANSQFICAVRIDNTATCWGYDKYGVFDCLADNFFMWLEGGIGRNDEYGVPECQAETCPNSIYVQNSEASIETEGWPVCGSLPTDLIYTREIASMATDVGFICAIHTDTTVFCWGYDIIIQGFSASGKAGRSYTDPNRNLAYIVAPTT